MANRKRNYYHKKRGNNKNRTFGKIRQMAHSEVWHDLCLPKGMYFGEDDRGLWASWGLCVPYPVRLHTKSGTPIVYSKPNRKHVLMWRFVDGQWVCAPEQSKTAHAVRADLDSCTEEQRIERYHSANESGRLKGFPSCDPVNFRNGARKTKELRKMEADTVASFDDTYATIRKMERQKGFDRIAAHSANTSALIDEMKRLESSTDKPWDELPIFPELIEAR